MKSLTRYILEKEEKKDDHKVKLSDIKFTIWKGAKNKVKWINDDEDFTKIVYTYEDNDKGVYMQFLLGKFKGDTPAEKSIWNLWCGKIGAVAYDDDPWCSLDTEKFADALNYGAKKAQEIIDEVYADPHKWIQFYKDI